MLIVLSLEEAEQAAHQQAGLDLRFKVYDQKAIGVTHGTATSMLSKFGLGGISDLTFVKLQVQKVENNTIFLQCNSAIKMLSQIIANVKTPGLLEQNSEGLIINLNKVPNAQTALKYVSLKSISFKDNVIVLDVALFPTPK